MVILMSEPLRYNISDWHQLSGCQSNNSRDLRIFVSDFIQDSRLVGLRIQICHADFGILFSCILNARGSLVSKLGSQIAYELSTDTILSILRKYGFLITFNSKAHLPQDQLDYLKSVQAFGFDKIRVISVPSFENSIKISKSHIVAFNVDKNPKWIDNLYSPSYKEFRVSLETGSTVILSRISDTNKWSWGWLDYVASIDDILKDNMDGE